MPVDLDESFPATADGLRTALEAIDRFCVACNLNGLAVSRVRIIVEELFTNTIKYGYGGECDRPVRLCLGGMPLCLIFEDDAPPFDPTGWKCATDTAPDQQPEGQAGIPLILRLGSQVRYDARQHGNRIAITIES